MYVSSNKMEKENMDIINKSEENHIFEINLLKQKWEAIQKLPNIFAYNLNVQSKKYLSGELRFYAELNLERTSLRRPPQTISSLKPIFNEDQFNFTKIKASEQLQTIPFNDIEVAFIINKSPLTKYHTLICPELNACQAQKLTLNSLDFSLKVMLSLKIDGSDKAFRIGYNSPGALASVNHLHLHLMYIEAQLYIDHVILEPIFSDYVFRLKENMPTEAICWIFCKTDDEVIFKQKLQFLYDAILWLCDNNRPHNLFMTQDITMPYAIKVFLFARENYCYVKNTNNCNIGFCELAGYVPVGNAELYKELSESLIITKICNETGTVYKDFYDFIVQYKNK